MRRRWPFLVAAVLVLGLGAAGGALAQRLYRTSPDEEALDSDDEIFDETNEQGASTAGDARARRPASDPFDFFDNEPDPRPPAANKAPAQTTPRPKLRRGGGSGQGANLAPDVDQFGSRLATQLCEKLTDCGLLDFGLGLGTGANGSAGGMDLCDLAASALQDPEAAERVRRGECKYDSDAAAKCLDALGSLSCDHMDPDGLLAFADSMGSCSTAFRCD